MQVFRCFVSSLIAIVALVSASQACVNWSTPPPPAGTLPFSTSYEGETGVSVSDQLLAVQHVPVGEGGNNPILEIYDISDPTTPVSTWCCLTCGSGNLGQTLISGNLLYNISGCGVHVLDVTTPSSPTVLDILPGAYHQAALQGDRLYVTTTKRFDVIDVSDPSNLSLLGSSPLLTAGQVYGMCLLGNYAYVVVTAGPFGIKVMDVSDPVNIVQAGFTATPDFGYRLVARGSTLYYGGNIMRIYDISNAAAPVQISTVPAVERVLGLHVDDNGVVYFSDRDGIACVSTVDPASPIVIGRTYDPGPLGFGGVAGNSTHVWGHDVGFPEFVIAFPLQCVPSGAPIVAASRDQIELLPPFPNPASHETAIHFSTTSSGPVRLDVVDVTGRRVRTLVDEVIHHGKHQMSWDLRDGVGRSVAHGVYYIRLMAGGVEKTRSSVVVDGNGAR